MNTPYCCPKVKETGEVWIWYLEWSYEYYMSHVWLSYSSGGLLGDGGRGMLLIEIPFNVIYTLEYGGYHQQHQNEGWWKHHMTTPRLSVTLRGRYKKSLAR